MSVVVVFTSRRSAEHDEEYGVMSERMVELVHDQPGFLRMTSVRDPRTRQGITVAWFADEPSVRAWKAHVEHLEAQRRGVERFYDEYEVTVATVDREYGWSR